MKDHHRVRAFIDGLEIKLEALTFNYKGDIIAIKSLGMWVAKNFIVEKCSGLKDKNGKLIYERDDIKASYDRYRVLFEDGAFYVEKKDLPGFRMLLSQLVGTAIRTGLRRINSVEIVGRSHKTPELSDPPQK